MRLVNSYLKIKINPDGIRRVPTNVRSLTGEVDGQEFESSLERDFLLLKHWEEGVDWYQVQPFKIEYIDIKGDSRTYTPDLFVTYHHLDKTKPAKIPEICEVKYREDLFKDWKILKPKFKAARQYAKEQGCNFIIATEKEIRTPYLENVQFLWSYRFADFHSHHYDKLMLIMEELDSTCPQTLLNAAYSSKTLRGEALWTLWCMIARRWIFCDLTEPLTMLTPIWINE